MDGNKIARLIWTKKQAIKSLEEDIEELFGMLPISDTRDYAFGDYIVSVRPTRRFDPRTAEENLTPEEFASTLATKPDSATAKKVLSPERYALAQKNFGVTRRIVEVTD